MRNATTKSSGKVLATVALLAGAAGVAGLGTFGSFTSTTSASQALASGTVTIALGASGPTNRLSVAAAGLVPGDTIQRAVTLTNTGSQNLSSITLTTTASPTSKLDTDTTNGLHLTLDACSAPWTEAGTAPAYTYTCTGTTTTVLANQPVTTTNAALTGLTSLTGSINASDNLRATLNLPSTADNTFQGLASTLNFTFTATQRTASAH